MFKSFSLRVLTALAVVMMLGVLVTAVPAEAAGSPVENSAVPAYGQHIPWAAFQGAPTIVNGKNDIWVWNENVSGQNVLHIRTTTDDSSHTFTGTVTTGAEGNFYNLAVFNGDGDDSATMVGYDQFTFSIVTTAGGEGVDVDWSGRWLALDLFIDGLHRPAHVLYGASATAANRMPLVVLARNNGLLTLPLTMLDGTTGYQKNVADGYFLYRDANGYHLRLTTTKVGDIVDYKGAIVADNGRFGAIRVFRGDRRDYYRLIGDKLLDFRFITNGGQDGLDWRLIGGGGLIFTLKMNGQVAAPDVSLGSNPFGTIQALTFRLTP
jgi:hypothetical protein